MPKSILSLEDVLSYCDARIPEGLCKCGCGGLVSFGKELLPRHRDRIIRRIKHKTTPKCACGCNISLGTKYTTYIPKHDPNNITAKEQKRTERIQIRQCLACNQLRENKHFHYYEKLHERGSICVFCKSQNMLEQNIVRLYNLTMKEYNQLLVAQNNSCKICGILFTKTKKSQQPHVDHCHTTKKVRGLLCQSCNSVIGFAKDNLETLQKAVDYLVEHKESSYNER